MSPYREPSVPKQMPAGTVKLKTGYPIAVPKAAVPASSMVLVEVPVDIALFRTEQICLDPVSAVHFDIEAFYVDAHNVLNTALGVPATIFASACIPQLKFPTCQPGQKITLAVRNTTDKEQVFGGGVLIGTTL